MSLAVRAAAAFTMKSSSLLLLMLLALGTLAPWAVEGGTDGEFQSPWCNLGYRVKGGGSWWRGDVPFSRLSLVSGDLPEGGFTSTWAPRSLQGLLRIWKCFFKKKKKVFIYLFLERGEGRLTEREKNINV